jgi:hypothetical protein
MVVRRLSVASAAVLASVLLAPTVVSAAPRTRSEPAVIQTTHGGFAWGDAAIGAAATLGLVLAAAGVFLLLKGNRRVP